MSADLPWALEELVPHAHPMILIDEISEPAESHFTASVRITEDCPFFETSHGVPTYVGIEYIAQTVAALVGLRAKQVGADVRLGYLLGTRKFETTQPYFVLGSMLSIQIEAEFESSELAKYAGEVRQGSGNPIVKASVTVYSGQTVQPQSPPVGATGDRE